MVKNLSEEKVIERKTGRKMRDSFNRFTTKKLLWALLLSSLYFLWVGLFMKIRDDHFIFAAILLVAYFAHPISRKIFYGFIWIFLYWLIYDSLRVYPNFWVNPVHIVEPYLLEKSWFGIEYGNRILTPNEYWALNRHPFLGAISGLFYLSWVPVPFAFAIWLYFYDKKVMLQFTFAFFLVNMIAILIYYLYPAAPPWYVKDYGFELLDYYTPGSAAGLLEFDTFFNVAIFTDMYEKNGNVFAAIPSMHAAFPVLTTYFALREKKYIAAFFFFITILGIWFAAVYTFHHYVIDILAGALCTLVTIVIIEWMIRNKYTRRWYLKYAKLLS